MADVLLAKYIPQVCGTEIHNETLTTPSTYCSKLLFLSKQQTTSSRTRVREVLESMHSVASMPTHAQQTYTQSGAYPHDTSELQRAAKPNKKTGAIARPLRDRPRDFGDTRSREREHSGAAL